MLIEPPVIFHCSHIGSLSAAADRTFQLYFFLVSVASWLKSQLQFKQLSASTSVNGYPFFAYQLFQKILIQ
jgi:hypothetical protein